MFRLGLHNVSKMNHDHNANMRNINNYKNKENITINGGLKKSGVNFSCKEGHCLQILQHLFIYRKSNRHSHIARFPNSMQPYFKWGTADFILFEGLDNNGNHFFQTILANLLQIFNLKSTNYFTDLHFISE